MSDEYLFCFGYFERCARGKRHGFFGICADGCQLLLFRIDVVEIHEPCAHEVQFGGMCANCGQDMTV